MSILNRFKSAYNAFTGRSPTTPAYYSSGSSARPDRMRHRIQNERSIVNIVMNRIAVDVSSIDIKHVRLDENGNYDNTISDYLNSVLGFVANIDQTGRELIRDLTYSMLDEGCVALFPCYTSADPHFTESYDVEEARVAKIIEWFPDAVVIEAYDENHGQKRQVYVEKKYIPIMENPFYYVMNEPNSTLQRFLRVMNQLDQLNERVGAGKIDLLVQLPYPAKSDAQKRMAEERVDNIQAQLTHSKFGIAYIDGVEKVIQLNRPIENDLWNQAKELKGEFLNQMGMTMEILNGTANDEVMTNYYSRIIEPIITTIVENIERKWISPTARSQRQAIRYFRDPFKLIPATQLAELGDKLTRNEIMTSNEVRVRIGLEPSKDPKADELRNSNLKQIEENKTDTIVEEEEKV